MLLRLYRLDALVAITESDRRGAVYATIRVVTIDPEAAPDPELGPELAEMHESWAARLAEDVIRIGYQGKGGAWVDGRKVTGPWIEVYAGEHLLQYDGPEGWVSRVEEVDRNRTLGPPGATPPPEPEPEELPKSGGVSGRRVALLTAGAGLAAGGGAMLLTGHFSERRFLSEPYDASTYGGCAMSEACWATEREAQIRQDAASVRSLYIAGYAAAGLGMALVGAELFILPDPVAGGGSVRFSGRF